MSLEVKIPSVGESITSGVLSVWHKKDGEAVKAGDMLFTLDTEKVSTEITAEAAGVLHTKVAEGAEVKIGEVVATIDETGKPAAAQPAPAAASKPAPSEKAEAKAEKKEPEKEAPKETAKPAKTKKVEPLKSA